MGRQNKAFSWADLVHRIGRGGRYGSKALAINFVGDEDLSEMTGDALGNQNPLKQFEEKTIEQLAVEVENQLSTKSEISME